MPPASGRPAAMAAIGAPNLPWPPQSVVEVLRTDRLPDDLVRDLLARFRVTWEGAGRGGDIIVDVHREMAPCLPRAPRLPGEPGPGSEAIPPAGVLPGQNCEPTALVLLRPGRPVLYRSEVARFRRGDYLGETLPGDRDLSQCLRCAALRPFRTLCGQSSTCKGSTVPLWQFIPCKRVRNLQEDTHDMAFQGMTVFPLDGASCLLGQCYNISEASCLLTPFQPVEHRLTIYVNYRLITMFFHVNIILPLLQEKVANLSLPPILTTLYIFIN